VLVREYASDKNLGLIGAQARGKDMCTRKPTIRHNMAHTRYKHK